jgi:C-terminal processing protease CtpA/Prc
MTPAERRSVAGGRLAAYEVAPGTVLVRVPSFNDPHGIDSVFAAEGDRIRNSDRLIIDVRGNGGGSDYNYREFVPLLYTNPMQMIGMDVLATEDNIASQVALATDTTFPAGQRAELRSLAERMRKHPGWVQGSDGRHMEWRVLQKPRVVAVLVDQGCASSCEQFLLMARQSSKVTIYGDRSGGVLDYANVRSTTMPGGTLILARPITRSRRLPKEPIDNIGIAPDVRIPASVLLQVPWVLQHMKP